MRVVLLCLALVACTRGERLRPQPQPPGTTPAVEWTQGPPCIDDSGSCGVPLHPTRTDEGFVIDVPPEPRHVNYVTKPTGSLTGASRIRMRFRVEGGPIMATKPRGEGYPGMIYLYFERAGNDFTGGAEQNFYRWWAPASQTHLQAGEYELVASFDDLWTAVSYGANICDESTANDDPDCRGPAMYQAALASAGRVGFTLGGGDGKGHGVHGPGRIIVTYFAVE